MAAWADYWQRAGTSDIATAVVAWWVGRVGVSVIGSVRVGLGFVLDKKSVDQEDMGCTARRR